MRLIDADALRNALNDAGGTGAERGGWADGWCKAIDAAIRMLEKAPTVEPERQWIPVTERLPETSKQYLVTADELRWPKSTYDSVDSPTERLFVTSMYFDCTNKLWHDSDGFVINALIDPEDVLNGCVAVAWLPLPEPYTPAEEEGNA